MASIQGTAGNDILSGTAGGDDISGLAGNDQINAGAGDDLLMGGDGDDILDGGTGFDSVIIDNRNDPNPVSINLVTGVATGAISGNDTLQNIEDVSAYGLGDITITGSANDEVLLAFGSGRNTVSAGAGNDAVGDQGHNSILDGGSGSNGLVLYRGQPAIGSTVATSFTQTFTPGVNGTLADGTTYSNFDYYNIHTDKADDTVTFNQLKKRPSNGSLITNWFDGGAGNDTAVIDLSNYSTQLIMTPQSSGDLDIVDAGAGVEVIYLTHVENVRLTGGSANDTFTAGPGSDVLTGNGGNDTLDGGEGPDMARYSGLSSDYRIDKLSSTSYRVTDLRAGSPDGIDTLSNIERLQWGDGSVTTLFNSPPTLSTHDTTLIPGQSVALSSLFSVSDVDGNAMTRYQLWDSTHDPSSGYFVVGGVAQAARTVIDITASQLGQTFFVPGSVKDDLQIRAYDGDRWSAADNATWAPFTVTVDNPPQLSTHNMNVPASQLGAVTLLFTDSDVDGNARTRYQLWDSTRDPNSGSFIVNGVVQAAGTVIDITAAQLSQTFFVTGTVDDNLQIRAFDGTFWSAADNAPWSPFEIGPHVNRIPTFAFPNPVSASPGQSIALSSIIATSDPDGDAITRYQFWDSTRDPDSGNFVVNGVAQPAGTIIDVTAAQLAQTSFVAGLVPDSIQGRAFDGTAWSSGDSDPWATTTIGVPVNHAPVVTTASVFRPRLHSYALSSLFSVSDADGDTITKYQLWDSNRDSYSGFFSVNGVPQAAGTVITITAAQLAQTVFNTGSLSDSLQIRAFDGTAWSAPDNAPWSPFVVDSSNTAPVLTTSNVTRAHLQSYALSSLFSISDADGDTMTRYQLWDSNRDPNSGHFVVQGVAKDAGQIIDITDTQFSSTFFVTGTVGDTLQIRAYDGYDWSAADNASWAPFTVTIPANNVPVVATSNVTRAHLQSYALSSLIQVSDADGDTITKYQLWDSTRDINSGHFMIGNQVQQSATLIEITPQQLAQTVFVTGEVGDTLQIRAFDGISWSAADNVPWSPFTITVPADNPPSLTTQDVNTTPGQTLALSSLFQVSDADGDSMTRYQLWDSTRDPASGSFVIGNQVQAPGTVIDITAAQLSQTSFVTGTLNDTLQIRAFDGISWSAADNASWAPFHVNVS